MRFAFRIHGSLANWCEELTDSADTSSIALERGHNVEKGARRSWNRTKSELHGSSTNDDCSSGR